MTSTDLPAAQVSPPSDSRSLLVSVWASAAFAVLSLGWGLAIDSQMIIFDGLYSFVSVLLSLLAVLALRTVRKGADDSYPWGREVWEPLTIVLKSVALGGLCVYALVGAVGELLRGGREINAGSAVAYAVLASAGGLAVSVYLRRRSRGRSGLVRAEAAEWFGDTLLSLGVLVGFGIALVLELTDRGDLARYVDPAMVAIVSGAFLWVPLRLLTGGAREVLSMAPSVAIREQLRACVDEVQEQYGFSESFLRASKVGGRIDIEIDFVVGESCAVRTVEQFDVVRDDIEQRLRSLDYQPWMTISFTADRRWAL